MAEAPLLTRVLPAGDPREAVIARWRMRSRIVAFWRLVLPLSIFAIGLGLAGWIVARSVLEGPIGEAAVIANRLMTSPRFYFRDELNRASLLTAANAVSDAVNRDKVTLESPSFNLGGGSVRANKGIYVKGSDKILLHGNVVAINSDGSRMTTEDAQIDTRHGTVSNSNAPHSGGIRLETNNGVIVGRDDYIISKNGSVTFRGRVHGVINGK